MQINHKKTQVILNKTDIYDDKYFEYSYAKERGVKKRMQETNPMILGPLITMYDKTLEENLSMYDKMPYKRDDTLCNRSSVRLISGNIIKYYRYKIIEPYMLDSDLRF